MDTSESLESLLDQYLELKTAVESFKKEIKDLKAPTEEEFTKLCEIVLPWSETRSAIIEIVRSRTALPRIENPHHRAALASLIPSALQEVEKDHERHRENPDDLSREDEGAMWDFVYANGTPRETYLRYQEFRPLVAASGLTNEIISLIEEARNCYAWGQFTAAIVLGRVVLEVGMNNIGERIGLFTAGTSLDDIYRDYPPSQRADKLFGNRGSQRREEFRRLYGIGSSVVHSKPGFNPPGPTQFVNDVIQFLSNEYAIHGKRMRDRDAPLEQDN